MLITSSGQLGRKLRTAKVSSLILILVRNQATFPSRTYYAAAPFDRFSTTILCAYHIEWVALSSWPLFPSSAASHTLLIHLAKCNPITSIRLWFSESLIFSPASANRAGKKSALVVAVYGNHNPRLGFGFRSWQLASCITMTYFRQGLATSS